MQIFPTSLLLGLAGIDPTGAIIIITALAMGVKKSKIMIFILTVFFGTVLVGVIGSYFILDSGIDFLASIFNYIPDYIYMILEFIVGIVLLKWFLERTFFKEKKKVKQDKKDSVFTKYIKKGLFFVGILFSLSALTDPSFLALITLTGQSTDITQVILANSFWVVISQFPIFILLVALIFNKHEKMIIYLKEKIATSQKIEKIKKVLYIILSVIILLASLISITEAIYYFITNTWLF